MLINLHGSIIVSTFAVSFDDRGLISDDRLIFLKPFNSKTIMSINTIPSRTSRQSSSIRTGKASKPDYSVKLSGLGAKSVGKQAVKDDLRIEKHQSPIASALYLRQALVLGNNPKRSHLQ